jgi:hypothetical protein
MGTTGDAPGKETPPPSPPPIPGRGTADNDAPGNGTPPPKPPPAPPPIPGRGTADDDAPRRPRGADLAGLRSRAWRDDAGAQMSLAMRLGDAHRRGADESSMVEAAYWAGRAWQAPVPASPAALAAFVSANCGSATIASHWVCTEAE